MPQTYSPKEINASYRELPQILKEAMFSADVADLMFGVWKAADLGPEKAGPLSEETGYVVLGLTPPGSFTDRLAERLNIQKDKARSIATEINHKLFIPLGDELKKIHQVEFNDAVFLGKEPAKETAQLPVVSTEELINPPTFSRGIVPREKDLKTPFVPAARPLGILEGEGIKEPHLPKAPEPIVLKPKAEVPRPASETRPGQPGRPAASTAPPKTSFAPAEQETRPTAEQPLIIPKPPTISPPPVIPKPTPPRPTEPLPLTTFKTKPTQPAVEIPQPPAVKPTRKEAGKEESLEALKKILEIEIREAPQEPKTIQPGATLPKQPPAPPVSAVKEPAEKPAAPPAKPVTFTPLDKMSNGARAEDERRIFRKLNKSPVLRGGDLTGFTKPEGQTEKPATTVPPRPIPKPPRPPAAPTLEERPVKPAGDPYRETILTEEKKLPQKAEAEYIISKHPPRPPRYQFGKNTVRPLDLRHETATKETQQATTPPAEPKKSTDPYHEPTE